VETSVRSLLLARVLVGGTLVYNVLEGAVALFAAFQAGSLALLTFGADSYLEVAAAAFVYWRLNISDEARAERAEGRIYRLIGWTFLLLAAAVSYQALVSLARGAGAAESTLGIILALASVTVMPAVALGKLKVAATVGLPVLAAEAKETLACSYLSLTLLFGLVANALLSWWWIDALTALFLVPWLVVEGLEGVRGDHCGEGLVMCSCRACWYGLRPCPLPCCVVSA